MRLITSLFFTTSQLLAVFICTTASAQGLYGGAFPDLFILNVDGSGERRLTNDLKIEGGASWSPNGKQIVFSGQHGLNDIYIINADGTGEINLTETLEVSEGSPAWSPNGNRIAFSAGTLTVTELPNNGISRSLQVSQIYLMNADGSDVVQLTDSQSMNHSPAWSPDGKQIAFSSNRLGGLSEIFLMDSTGDNVQMLTDYPDPKTFCLNPAWSPNGKQIAFTKHFDRQQADIYMMNADGSDLFHLTDYPGVEESPAWSPDGQWIAFVATVDRWPQIFRSQPDGSNAQSLTEESPNRGPAWSPDGKQIIFQSMRKAAPRAEPMTNKYVLWEDGGISIDLLADVGPEFRYGVRHADGTTTVTPLTNEEAAPLLRERGLESLIRP